MKIVSDNLLSSVDRYTKRFGFINSAISAIVDKVVPQVTAAACGTPGTFTCYYYCGGPCGNGVAYYRVYASSYDSCYYGYTFQCLEGCPSLCNE